MELFDKLSAKLKPHRNQSYFLNNYNMFRNQKAELFSGVW